MDGEGRGDEAGQEAEEGDEPEFAKEIESPVSRGSSSRPVVAAGRGLPSERLEGVVGEEVELRKPSHGCRRRPDAQRQLAVWLLFRQR